MKPLLDGAIVLSPDNYRIRIDELEEEKSSLEKEVHHLQELLKQRQQNWQNDQIKAYFES